MYMLGGVRKTSQQILFIAVKDNIPLVLMSERKPR